MGISEKWSAFQPSKGALVWTAVGTFVATVAIGFTVGGWVTGGTAQDMARKAADASHADLTASICVENFKGVETARADFEQLGSLRSLQQRSFVQDAVWAQIPGTERIGRDAAARCAERIAALDPEDLPTPVAEVEDDPAATIQ